VIDDFLYAVRDHGVITMRTARNLTDYGCIAVALWFLPGWLGAHLSLWAVTAIFLSAILLLVLQGLSSDIACSQCCPPEKRRSGSRWLPASSSYAMPSIPRPAPDRNAPSLNRQFSHE
jgi:hypothetical protein